jgi:uncharacterized protein YaiL (DUF2058 family)
LLCLAAHGKHAIQSSLNLTDGPPQTKPQPELDTMIGRRLRGIAQMRKKMGQLSLAFHLRSSAKSAAKQRGQKGRVSRQGVTRARDAGRIGVMVGFELPKNKCRLAAWVEYSR